MINQPIVHVKNNQVFANSKDVAAYFGKRHGNVVRDIRVHMEHMKQVQICTTPTFIEIPEINQQNGMSYVSFDMDKDAFTLLVMGYTGAKAMEFKLAYIQRFNYMEEQLRNQQPQLPDFTNPAEAARAFAEQYEKKITPTQIEGICCEDA